MNDGDSFMTQAPDERKEVSDAIPLEAAGRFVHQNDIGSRRDRATYLNHLPRSDRQFSDATIRTYFRVMKTLEHFQGLGTRGFPIEPNPPRRVRAPPNVPGNA